MIFPQGGFLSLVFSLENVGQHFPKFLMCCSLPPALRFSLDLCVFVCVCVCVCVYQTISYLTCCTASTNTDVEYVTYAVVEHGLSCMEYA